MSPKRAVNLVQVSDLHLPRTAGRRLHRVDCAARWQAALTYLDRWRQQIDAVVVTGDIGHDVGSPVYERVRGQLLELGCPVRVVPGNHDVPTDFATVFARASEPVAYRLTTSVGPWRLIALDSQVPDAVHGRIGREQLTRLGRSLARAPATPTVVALHHPVCAVGTPWLDRHCVEDADKLLKLLGRYPGLRALICGHVHHVTERAAAPGLRQLTAPSIAAAFRPGSLQFTTTLEPPAVRWLRLMPDGSLETSAEMVV